MSCPANLDKSLVKRIEFRVLELCVVETKEVVHDDVAGQCGKGVGEVDGLLPFLEFFHAGVERVDMSTDDVQQIQNGPPGEPAESMSWCKCIWRLPKAKPMAALWRTE